MFLIVIVAFLNYTKEHTPRLFQIYDGTSSTAHLLAKVQGHQTFPPYILSTGTDIYMLFFSNDNTTLNGYNITYEAKHCKIILHFLTMWKT